MFSRWMLGGALVVGGMAMISGCGGPASGAATSGAATSGAATEGGLRISASFYPLQYVTQRIAGERAVVSSLTPPGAEPHDLELTAKDVARISDADLVVYLGGFQPAVDDAVKVEGGDHAENVAAAAQLDRTVTEQGEGAGTDPHFWLDPQRLSTVSTRIEQRLAELDPAGAAVYRANLTSLTAELTALDAEFRTGLASCANRYLVTSHQAFGYLSARYGLTQIGISNLTPEAEPNAATLARVADFVRRYQVRTIYHETLASPASAEAVARETGARTGVLDPIEGITGASQGRDYFAIMRADLTNLKQGQPCS